MAAGRRPAGRPAAGRPDTRYSTKPATQQNPLLNKTRGEQNPWRAEPVGSKTRGDLFLKSRPRSASPATPQNPLLHKTRYSTKPATQQHPIFLYSYNNFPEGGGGGGGRVFGNCLKVGLKIHFRPKNRGEKELRGENGAFDTETSRFHTMREVRSARKCPKTGNSEIKICQPTDVPTYLFLVQQQPNFDRVKNWCVGGVTGRDLVKKELSTWRFQKTHFLKL